MDDMERRTLIAGNWKMNGSVAMAEALVDALVAACAEAGPFEGTDLLVMPPFVYLDRLRSRAASAGLSIGAQDLSEHEAGAFTGEVSGSMLADVGAGYVLVGHSERRQYHGDSNDVVAAKFEAALAAGLKPVLCVGESREQREAGETEAVVSAQIDAVLSRCGVSGFSGAVVAYEPVWAIGTGLVATPEQAQRVHAFIRARLARHDATIAGRIQILYGGSMKPQNAADLLACKDIDGGLIGGASLKADKFIAIAQQGVAAAG
jgi:triosephosphate isomerase